MVKRWKLILAMIVVFCCGTVLGLLLTLVVVQHRFEARMNSENWSPRTISWLTSELELTTEQQNQIKPFVDNMTDSLKQLQQNVDTERKVIFGKMLVEINHILTSDQRSQLKVTLQQSAERIMNTKPSKTGGHP